MNLILQYVGVSSRSRDLYSLLQLPRRAPGFLISS
jgi:hypothetical protein